MMGVGHGDGLALQPLLEFRIALGDGDMADGIPQGTLLTDDNADFLGTRDGCIDEVALEHDIVGEVDGNDNDGIFTALALMDGRGVSGCSHVALKKGHNALDVELLHPRVVDLLDTLGGDYIYLSQPLAVVLDDVEDI